MALPASGPLCMNAQKGAALPVRHCPAGVALTPLPPPGADMFVPQNEAVEMSESRTQLRPAHEAVPGP